MYTHFENFYHTFLIVGDVHSLKDFTVFTTTQFSHYLIVILLSENKQYGKASD